MLVGGGREGQYYYGAGEGGGGGGEGEEPVLVPSFYCSFFILKLLNYTIVLLPLLL